jgi:hypothetical protein
MKVGDVIEVFIDSNQIFSDFNGTCHCQIIVEAFIQLLFYQWVVDFKGCRYRFAQARFS